MTPVPSVTCVLEPPKIIPRVPTTRTLFGAGQSTACATPPDARTFTVSNGSSASFERLAPAISCIHVLDHHVVERAKFLDFATHTVADGEPPRSPHRRTHSTMSSSEDQIARFESHGLA